MLTEIYTLIKSLSFLEKAVIFILTCYTNASLMYHLQFAFRYGNIFQYYLVWLAIKCIKPDEEYNRVSQEFLDKIKIILSEEDKADMEIEFRKYLFTKAANDTPLFKILGGCDTCSNIWLASVTFWLLVILFPIIPINIATPFIYLSYILLCGAFYRLYLKDSEIVEDLTAAFRSN